MNNLLKFSEAEIRSWDEEITKLSEKMLQTEMLLTKDQFLTELEVCSFLGVSDRTMRTYRQQKYFHFIKLNGRILYMRTIFLKELLIHNSLNWRIVEKE